ncbi:MAG: ABC transporter substrate-binding protein [Spirochaetota bacterium]
MNKNILRRYSAYIFILISALYFCTEKNPIKIGFAGGLTGIHSDLGIAGRNGALLAVEEITSAGGIKGRPVVLITKDDQQDPVAALKVDKELIDEGVVAIIGHMTSVMTMSVIPFINKSEILMISPTTSTNELTNIDDYFFRTLPANKDETDAELPLKA